MPLERIREAFLKTMKFSLGQAYKTELLEINPGLGMWEGFGGQSPGKRGGGQLESTEQPKKKNTATLSRQEPGHMWVGHYK